MKILAPSILSADFSNLSQQIRYVEMAGVNWIHCDIMDGKFVPNITFGPMVVNAVHKITKLPLDVHLMIENPENYFEEFVKSGAAYITIHQEAVIHLDRQLNKIRELGARPGISINPGTPVSVLKEVLPLVDLVLVMSVNPGFGGQKFIESSLDKIRDLVIIRKEKGLNFLIEVDGGINKENIQKVSSAGCDAFVAGAAIFAQNNISAAAVELKNLLNE